MIRPTLFLYIMGQFLLGITLAFIIITGIIMLVDFVELSRTVGSRDNVGMLDILVLTGLKAPQIIEETLPFVVLFGAMNALFRLNRRSELIIMRAAGLSAWRFLTPGILVTLMIGVLWSTVMNPVSARSAQLFTDIQRDMSEQASVKPQDESKDVKGLWLREGNDFSQTVIYANTANIETRTLSDVTFYHYIKDAEGTANFSMRYDAASAELTESGFWILREVMGTIEGRQRQSFESLSSPTSMSWDDLQAATGKNVDPSFWQLPSEIKKFQQAGFSATPQIIKFNRLLALPLTLTAMLLIAAGASMQLTRLGGTLSLIIFGISIGFIVYFANNMISAFGETGALPPLLAAWTVPIFIFLTGIARLCTLEDG